MNNEQKKNESRTMVGKYFTEKIKNKEKHQ